MQTQCKDLYDSLMRDIEVAKDYSPFVNLSADQLKLGKLSLKLEAAGKVRVFAIVDAWTQSLLSPLHKALFSILRNIPQDGTFNQLKPIKVLFEKGHTHFFSYDLSAATDRLPITLQVQVLSYLYNNESTAQL